jgi:hypothetical protein
MQKLLFLSLLGLGCVPKGAHPLTPLAAGPSASGTLTYSSAAALDSTPGMGLDLAVSITVENTGERPVRVDLTRARVSVDRQPFMTCRYGSSVDPSKLLVNLNKGDVAELYVSCRDIPKPIQTAELKFIASGTGAPGEIVVGWVGLGERP